MPCRDFPTVRYRPSPVELGLKLLSLLVLMTVPLASCRGGDALTPADRGYEFLRTHPYLPPDFNNDVFERLWTVWPEPERSEAAAADPARRRELTFDYYGLIRSPDNITPPQPALGYVGDAQGNWIMNCLSCHGGQVAGRIIPGLPNSHLALQTLTEDVRKIKLMRGMALSHLDLATLKLPLSTTNGTTNAVVFGIVLGSYRHPDMSVDLKRKVPPLRHHDMDAPPFWNVRKKRMLYADGHAPKTARPLMQFLLLPTVSRDTLEEWEPQFADLLTWIESLEPPRYPFEVDTTRAGMGEPVYRDHCARCHGTPGRDGAYPQKIVPLDEIGTDPERWRALAPEHRQWVKEGWVSRFGADPVEVDSSGYVAPPLDGIWASAPYFHNGSVPTLWHVLHPDERPPVWKRTATGYDQPRVGLEVSTFDSVPVEVRAPAHRRRYFDTRLPGKSAAGHRFPDVLTEEQKQNLLEYLKTL